MPQFGGRDEGRIPRRTPQQRPDLFRRDPEPDRRGRRLYGDDAGRLRTHGASRGRGHPLYGYNRHRHRPRRSVAQGPAGRRALVARGGHERREEVVRSRRAGRLRPDPRRSHGGYFRAEGGDHQHPSGGRPHRRADRPCRAVPPRTRTAARLLRGGNRGGARRTGRREDLRHVPRGAENRSEGGRAGGRMALLRRGQGGDRPAYRDVRSRSGACADGQGTPLRQFHQGPLYRRGEQSRAVSPLRHGRRQCGPGVHDERIRRAGRAGAARKPRAGERHGGDGLAHDRGAGAAGPRVGALAQMAA